MTATRRPPSTSGSGTGSPWSTTLATTGTAGDGTVTLTDALPQHTIASGLYNCYIVIGAWTPTAEARLCNADATGKILTLGGPLVLANTHPAGSKVLVVDEYVHVDWWAPQKAFGSSPSANVTAFNNCFAQLTKASAGFNYVFKVKAGPGRYPINDEIVLPQYGLASLEGPFALVCTTDFGSGKHAIKNAFSSQFPVLKDFTVESSNESMTMASFLSGGSNPPVAMHGVQVQTRNRLENVRVYGFNRGFNLSNFDHGTMRDCKATNCFYGYYFGAGVAYGDMSFTKCDAEGGYRALFGVSPGCSIEGSSFRDASWTNSPWTFFFEGDGRGSANGGGMADILFSNCNREFHGNGYAYIAPGAGRVTIWMHVVPPDIGPSGGGGGGTWLDTNYPVTAAIYNDSATIMFVQHSEWHLAYPGNATYVFDNGTSASTQFDGPCKFIGPGPAGIVKTALDDSNGTMQVRLVVAEGVNYAPAGGRMEVGEGPVVYVTGTVTRGDLVESVIVSTVRRVQRYQTSAAAPMGVAYWDASGNSTTILTSGIARINVNAANTVAAGKYVKPDTSNAGCVVEATSFSDGPIVGFTEVGHETSSTSHYGTSSDRSVLVRLKI